MRYTAAPVSSVRIDEGSAGGQCHELCGDTIGGESFHNNDYTGGNFSRRAPFVAESVWSTDFSIRRTNCCHCEINGGGAVHRKPFRSAVNVVMAIAVIFVCRGRAIGEQ